MERIKIPPAKGNGETLAVNVTPNLYSAWLSETTGARAASEGGTICSITIGSELTHVAISIGGRIVDTACFDLGFRCLVYDADRRITQINDGGETFLDAVAKRIKVGDVLEESMRLLLGELIAETIVNLIVRKRPPQVSQRLLCGEPFTAYYQPIEYWLSGWAGSPSVPPDDLTEPLTVGILGALQERGLPYKSIRQGNTTPYAYETIVSEVPFLSKTPAVASCAITDYPILYLGQAPDGAWEPYVRRRVNEFMRRHNRSAQAPIAVACPAEAMQAIVSDQSFKTHIAFWLDNGAANFSEHDFLSMSSASPTIKRLLFKADGEVAWRRPPQE